MINSVAWLELSITSTKKRSLMTKSKVISTEDILSTLCHSVTGVLSSASGNSISYSAMVQKNPAPVCAQILAVLYCSMVVLLALW